MTGVTHEQNQGLRHQHQCS